MKFTIQPNKPPVPIASLTKTCGKYGIIVQSLDSNGSVFIGTDQGSLTGPVDANGFPPDGLQIQKSGAITNAPSVLPLVPFAGTLYAVNVGAAASVISIMIFPLE